MLLYSIIMFLVAAIFTVLSIAIYRGKTDLIHDYHQTKVTDKAAYACDSIGYSHFAYVDIREIVAVREYVSCLSLIRISYKSADTGLVSRFVDIL